MMEKQSRPSLSQLGDVSIDQTVSFAAQKKNRCLRFARKSLMAFVFTVGCASCLPFSDGGLAVEGDASFASNARQTVSEIAQKVADVAAVQTSHLSEKMQSTLLELHRLGVTPFPEFNVFSVADVPETWSGSMLSLTVERETMKSLREIDALIVKDVENWEAHFQELRQKEGPITAKDDAFKGGSILDLILHTEAKGNYNAYYGHVTNSKIKFTEMTVNEVLNWQKRHEKRGAASTAVGGYQFIRPTLLTLKRSLKLSGEEVMSPSFQDSLAVVLLQQAGLEKFQQHKLSANSFAHRLSKRWASLPAVFGKNKGRSYYHQPGFNEAHTSIKTVLTALKAVDVRLENEADVKAPIPVDIARHRDQILSTDQVLGQKKYHTAVAQTEVLAKIADSVGADSLATVSFSEKWDGSDQVFSEIDRVQLNILNNITTHLGLEGEYGYNYKSSETQINQLKTKLYFKLAGGEKLELGALPNDPEFWNDRNLTDQMQLFLIKNWVKKLQGNYTPRAVQVALSGGANMVSPTSGRLNDFKGYRAVYNYVR